MNRLAVCYCLLSAGLLIPWLSAADTDQWTQWRGPSRDCKLVSTAWPASLKESNLKQVFRVSLGDSYSGPIVTADRVFVTETVGPNEIVRALDRSTGAEIWKSEWAGSMSVPFFAASNGSWIRSTPAFSEGRLFVASMEDVLVCLDGNDGSTVWKKDFRKEFGTANQSFGFVCSPLVDEGSVYVQAEAGLLKLSCETGELQWKSLTDGGGMMGGAFSSPVIATIADTRQLVVQTRSKLAGVSLDSGEQLWSVEIPSFRGMNILTPTLFGDFVFTSSYGGGSFLFEVTRDGDTFKVNEVWKAKAEAYMSSPVVLDDGIYVHLRNQRFVCLDKKTGEPAWTTRPFGKYWSMVANGTKTLALDERGDLLLLDLSSQEFTMVDTLHLTDQPAWAHLAVAGNQVFVRDLKGLAVYEWAAE
ncbi:MAG: PQQ-binding-like beta-propeller repeat protein [Fuerstiella sp.]